MEFEAAESEGSAPSRREKSLGLLTMKFVSLLQEAKDGRLDLKEAADRLAVKQKRRIYDITNVLEGVGLIEKKNKNIIQWRDENSGSQTQEVVDQVKLLKAQISELEAREKELDSQRKLLEESIHFLNHDPRLSTYKFVTHEDICNAFRGDTLLAVLAPAGTMLEVAPPEMKQSGQKRYQVNLRSQSAPIQVMLINRDSDSSVPVVFCVPPTEGVCPTPPSNPYSLQSFPSLSPTYSIPNTSTSSSSCYSSQGSFSSDHQMALPQYSDTLVQSFTPDKQIDCSGQAAATLLNQQRLDLAGPDFQSVLDIRSLLKPNTADEQLKDSKAGAVDLIEELLSADSMDYSFNLDNNEGVCDLFDVAITDWEAVPLLYK
ncbi:transcription factor E2F5 isoform X2 [Nelusetta ayraudi]|uniref:transcription factor E2F5 isoform X2 n=1 Tax=Nelusetta ayraudi TaxID=303726 RepID=UPI003F71F85C